MFDLVELEEENKLILKGEFKVVHPDDNPISSVKIGFGLPSEVKNSQIK